MIQRISVRVRIMSGDRTLLLRRADGRESLLGKYELPGGRIREAEQPEDAARRIIASDAGISGVTHFRLEDAMTHMDVDDRNIQYGVIVYGVVIEKDRRSVKLGSHHDKYVWHKAGKVDQSAITELSQHIMGVLPELATPGANKTTKGDGAPERGVIVYTDGGSRGNPGHSAAGYVVIDKGELIDQGGEYIGVTTNNQAEYHGVRLGLEAAIRLGVRKLEMRIDSLLVVNQLKGIYKIKNRELWPVNERIRELIGQFERVSFTHVPREMNQLADGAVNRILDERKNNVI